MIFIFQEIKYICSVNQVLQQKLIFLKKHSCPHNFEVYIKELWGQECKDMDLIFCAKISTQISVRC